MGRHCTKCHYEENDERFRKKNPKNPATKKHVCPKNSKKHSFAECPTQYRLGHKVELAEIKKKQMEEKKAQEALERAAKKVEQDTKKAERAQATVEKEQQKEKTKKLKDRRLATKLPEFKRFLRTCGVVQEASPNYLNNLLAAVRQYLFEVQSDKQKERKRKVRYFFFSQNANEH